MKAAWCVCLLGGLVAAVATCEEDPDAAGSGASGGSAQTSVGSGAGGDGTGASSQGGVAQGGAAEGGSGGAGGATGGGEPCDADCRTHDLTATFTATTVAFERAYYGLTSPASSGSGDWEIYVESYVGGDPGCPTQTSATPDHTLIIAGHPAPLPASALTDANGLTATVLDFEGGLLGGPISSGATAILSTKDASDVCISCVGTGPDDDGFVAMDVELTFAEGTINGHVYATHCESLDAP